MSKIETQLKRLLDETSYEDLDLLWYLIGVCPRCIEPIEHHVNEPFASCRCGTGEDTGQPTFLQQLKHKQSGTYFLSNKAMKLYAIEIYEKEDRTLREEIIGIKSLKEAQRIAEQVGALAKVRQYLESDTECEAVFD